MTDVHFGTEYLKELETEATASRKCLERIPESLFNWKPHEKSMTMGYLALLVAEIPKWIADMVEKSEIDFAQFEHFKEQGGGFLLRSFHYSCSVFRLGLRFFSENKSENEQREVGSRFGNK